MALGEFTKKCKTDCKTMQTECNKECTSANECKQSAILVQSECNSNAIRVQFEGNKECRNNGPGGNYKIMQIILQNECKLSAKTTTK